MEASCSFSSLPGGPSGWVAFWVLRISVDFLEVLLGLQELLLEVVDGLLGLFSGCRQFSDLGRCCTESAAVCLLQLDNLADEVEFRIQGRVGSDAGIVQAGLRQFQFRCFCQGMIMT